MSLNLVSLIGSLDKAKIVVAAVKQILTAHGAAEATTTSQFYELVPDMSISITVEEDCDLLILFNGVFKPDPSYYHCYLCMKVDGTIVRRREMVFASQRLFGATMYEKIAVAAGTHTVEIHWRSPYAQTITAYKTYRDLVVIEVKT